MNMRSAFIRLRDAAPAFLTRGTAPREGREGQGMVEYALILVLIALVILIILAVLGHQVNNLYSNITSAVKR